MLQRGCWVIVEQLPRGDQVPCDRVRRVAIQSAELPADLGCQLLCLDLGRDRWSAAVIVSAAVLGLGSASAAGTRRGPLRWPPPPLRVVCPIAISAARLTTLATRPVVDHWYLSLRILV
jgi:hypothetical protein